MDTKRARPRGRTFLVLMHTLGMAAVLGGLAMLSGCPTTREPGPNEVFMRGIAFDPPEITIIAGESVTWTNMDLVPHTATSGNPGDADLGSTFRSGTLLSGETFTRTFEEPGTFVYFCEVHPTLMFDARVIVQPQP